MPPIQSAARTPPGKTPPTKLYGTASATPAILIAVPPPVFVSVKLCVAVAPVATLDIQYNDGVALQTAAITLNGAANTVANLTFTDAPGPFDYTAGGVVAVGTTTTKLYQINNIGGVDATAVADNGALLPMYVYTGGAYPGTLGTCGATITAGVSCDIEIDFAPTGVGLFPDTIQLNYNDGLIATNSQLGITGTAGLPALLSLTPGVGINYGQVVIGNTSTITMVVNNTGGR